MVLRTRGRCDNHEAHGRNRRSAVAEQFQGGLRALRVFGYLGLCQENLFGAPGFEQTLGDGDSSASTAAYGHSWPQAANGIAKGLYYSANRKIRYGAKQVRLRLPTLFSCDCKFTHAPNERRLIASLAGQYNSKPLRFARNRTLAVQLSEGSHQCLRCV